MRFIYWKEYLESGSSDTLPDNGGRQRSRGYPSVVVPFLLAAAILWLRIVPQVINKRKLNEWWP
jgi:hypothetical protein